MKLSFIIVNYNTRDLLKECVENLLKIKESIPESEIIVVDNKSFDGSDSLFDHEFKGKVTFIKNPKNNLPNGHNLGFAASTGDFILHLGTDCYPTVEALNYLMAYMDEHKDVGIATGRVELLDGSLDMDAHRGMVTPWVALTHWSGLDKLFPKSPLFSGYFLGYKDMTKPHEIDVCISHFTFVSREAYLKVGKWDDTYFMYGEDLDFCFQMQQAGYKIMYLPDIKILHYKGAGVGRKTTDGIDNASRRDYNHMKKVRLETSRAMRIFYQKNLAKRYPFFVNWAVYLGIFLLLKFRTVKYFLQGSGY